MAEGEIVDSNELTKAKSRSNSSEPQEKAADTVKTVVYDPDDRLRAMLMEINRARSKVSDGKPQIDIDTKLKPHQDDVKRTNFKGILQRKNKASFKSWGKRKEALRSNFVLLTSGNLKISTRTINSKVSFRDFEEKVVLLAQDQLHNRSTLRYVIDGRIYAVSLPTEMLCNVSCSLNEEPENIQSFHIQFTLLSEMSVLFVAKWICGGKVMQDVLELDTVTQVEVAVMSHKLEIRALQVQALACLRHTLVDSAKFMPNMPLDYI